MLDTRIDVQTPEGIELKLTPAGLLPRCLAWGTDLLIKAGVIICFQIAAVTIFDKFAEGPIYLFLFIVFWLYNVLFETFNNGKTPGKALMKIRVVQMNGSPVTFGAAVLRNLIRVVDFMPFLYLIGAGSTLFTRTFQRVGDIVAGTYVVYNHRQTQLVSTLAGDEKPLRLNLKTAEHQAIMLFEERLSNLSEERINEIAGLLVEHVNGTPAEIREQLRSHARWLTGGAA